MICQEVPRRERSLGLSVAACARIFADRVLCHLISSHLVKSPQHVPLPSSQGTIPSSLPPISTHLLPLLPSPPSRSGVRAGPTLFPTRLPSPTGFHTHFTSMAILVLPRALALPSYLGRSMLLLSFFLFTRDLSPAHVKTTREHEGSGASSTVRTFAFSEARCV